MILDLLIAFWVFVGALVSSYVMGRILCGIFFHLLDKRTRSETHDSDWPETFYNLADHYEWELDCDYASNPQGFRLVEKK